MNANDLKIFDAAAADSTGTPVYVKDYEKIIIQLGSASTANLTVNIQVSTSPEVPNFSAARTVANHWDYIEVIDLEDGAAIDGDAGIAFAAADDFRNLELNGSVRWVNATISSYVAGTLTLQVMKSLMTRYGA